MSVYKRGEIWWVDYTFRGQRIRKPISKKKSDALSYEAQAKTDILHKRHTLPKNEKKKFSELAMDYDRLHARHKKSYKTDKALLKSLSVYFGDYTIADIAIDAAGLIDHYKADRITARVRKGHKFPQGKAISKTTINRELALLRHMMSKAVEWGHISFNPLAGRKMMFPEKPKESILTIEELRCLITLAREPLKTQIIIALNTGMRKNEILKLKWDSVNLRERFIKTRSKTDKIRIIPLNDDLYTLLSEMSLRRGGRDYVMENPNTGKPFTENKEAWKFLLKRSRIKNFRFHDLRHCFATYALLNGGDLISLKEILGHTDIRTTSRYAKAMLEGQQRIVNSIKIGTGAVQVEDMPARRFKTS